MELRKRLFKQFWNMGDLGGRCVLLLYCTAKKEIPSTRKTFSIFGQKVCQYALMRTLQINESRLRVALYKYKHCDTFADCRGQTTGGKNKTSPTKKKEILRHISSFPKYISLHTSPNRVKVFKYKPKSFKNVPTV